jgi:hypothetical protein
MASANVTEDRLVRIIKRLGEPVPLKSSSGLFGTRFHHSGFGPVHACTRRRSVAFIW